MASVSSLDQDMRKLRLDRVTPQAEEEVRAFIQASLETDGQEIDRDLVRRIGQEKLFEFLGDGVCLCRLAERATSRSIRFAKKPGLFQARENIAMFTELCKKDPINLHSHDTFLTVDLVESKDLAQVLQCIGAFSRAAHRLQPSIFPTQIGGGTRRGVMSPQGTGTPTIGGGGIGQRPRGISNTSNTSSAAYNTSSAAYGYGRPASLTPSRTGESNSGRWSPTKATAGSVSSKSASSWIKKSDNDAAAPAWNEAQYGYIGGSNQGNLGVAFGSHRQIISASPIVPSLAQKEKARRLKKEEEDREQERLRQEAEAAAEREKFLEEEQEKLEESRRWHPETDRIREEKLLSIQEQKKKWAEEHERWQLELKANAEEDEAAKDRMRKPQKGSRETDDYQNQNNTSSGISDRDRIKELEAKLAAANERERNYQIERHGESNIPTQELTEDHERLARRREESAKARSRSRSRPRPPPRQSSSENWRESERGYLQQQWVTQQESGEPNNLPPPKSPRPLPEPIPPVRVKTNHTGPSSRPLPDPTQYASPKEHLPAFQLNQTLSQHDRHQTSSDDTKELQNAPINLKESASTRGLLNPQGKPLNMWSGAIAKEMEEDLKRLKEWTSTHETHEIHEKPRLLGPRPPPK